LSKAWLKNIVPTDLLWEKNTIGWFDEQ